MKSKKHSNLVYNYEVPILLTEKSGKTYCYFAFLDKLDANVEFRRTFCPLTFKLRKRDKRTSYEFQVNHLEGYFELGQQLTETIFRKMYFILKDDGTFHSIPKVDVTKELTRRKEIEDKELARLEQVKKQKKKEKAALGAGIKKPASPPRTFA